MGELEMLNVDQAQRRDIDNTMDNRLTLSIDEANIEDNPYAFAPEDFIGNNWFRQGNNIVKLNLAEQDSLVFIGGALSKLSQKDITKIIVEFDYIVSNVSINYPLLSNVSFTCMDMTNYMLVENILTTQGHIEVDCSLFNFSSNVVNTSISEQGFKVGINFNGNKSNATVKLSNVTINFEYSNKLGNESDSVVNRLEPQVDFWRDGDELILQIGGDASGKGMDRGGSSIDTYTKEEIDSKLELKVNTETGKGLSSNDYTLTEKTKLSTIETNANYYVHPSSHNSEIITESSALSRLETAANATQHEINLAINDKIGQGGGGGGGSYINDYYWDTTTQDIILDYSDSVDPSNIVTSWSTPLSNDKVPSEKLVKETIDNSGGGSSVNIVTDWEQTLSDSKVASEKLVKDPIDTKANFTHTHTVSQVTDFPNIPSKVSDLTNDSGFITSSSLPTKTSDLNNDSGFITSSSLPTKLSDLTNDSDFIETSSTAGLIKNDGSIDTNQYLTQHQSLTNYVQKSSTSGLIKNDGTIDTTSYLSSLPTHSHTKSQITDLETIPTASTSTPSADTTNGSYGSGSSYARSNHTHPKSSLYAASSHTHNYSDMNNVSVVNVTVTYTDSTTSTIKLLQYTGS